MLPDLRLQKAADVLRVLAKFPSIILYVLWRPETTARVFAEAILMEMIHQLEATINITSMYAISRISDPNTLEHVFDGHDFDGHCSLAPPGREVVKFVESPKYQEAAIIQQQPPPPEPQPPPKEASFPDRSSLDGHSQTSSSSNTKPNVCSKVYLVMDCMCPPLSADAVKDPEAKHQHFQVQVNLAEHLAHMVTSHYNIPNSEPFAKALPLEFPITIERHRDWRPVWMRFRWAEIPIMLLASSDCFVPYSSLTFPFLSFFGGLTHPFQYP
jgi:hypothetical protein